MIDDEGDPATASVQTHEKQKGWNRFSLTSLHHGHNVKE